MATNNSYDGRTKAGKNYRGKDGQGAHDHPHRDKDMALGLIAGMFKGAVGSTKKSGKKSKSDFSETPDTRTPEEIAELKAADDKWFKKNLPLLILVVLIGTILTILFWVWVISLFM